MAYLFLKSDYHVIKNHFENNIYYELLTCFMD